MKTILINKHGHSDPPPPISTGKAGEDAIITTATEYSNVVFWIVKKYSQWEYTHEPSLYFRENSTSIIIEYVPNNVLYVKMSVY